MSIECPYCGMRQRKRGACWLCLKCARLICAWWFDVEHERDRLTVRIIVRCNTEYDATLLHDQAEAAMKAGHVRLDFYTGNRT